MAQESSSPSAAEDLLAFIEASPTPYHAVLECERRLVAAGFVGLDERNGWAVEPGSAHYVVHDGSTIAAIRAGRETPEVTGIRFVGAHTDSPNLRLKPRPAKESAGQLLFDVEIYGSPILATWVDRELSIAGRATFHGDFGLTTRAFRVDRPIGRISSLAIHLNRNVNEDGLKLDKHRHLGPTFAIPDGEDPEAAARALMASALGVDPDAIVGFDACLYDTAAPTFVGRGGELIASARLDNLASCHAALTAILAAGPADSSAIALLYDHEEIGSDTAEGASGAFGASLVSRLCGGGERVPRAMARSLFVSADMAHAEHPSHPEKHDGVHAPRLNGGPVVKTNASRRYATDSETGGFFRALCKAQGVPCQEFVARADMACGSTIGPISAARLGVRTVDVGNPMLSMHSIRECAGRDDVASMIAVLARFYSARDPLPW